MKSTLFFLLQLMLLVLCLCVPQINEDFPYVFLYKFLVLCFAFRAVMHLELIFIEHVRVD